MNRIKEILEEKGVKQTWLAEKLDKSYNMVNSYVQNRRQPSIDDLFRIAEILGVEAKQLLAPGLQNLKTIDDFAMNVQTIRVPLLGTIPCGSPMLAEENIETYIPVSKDLIKSSHRYFILRASGNSMDEAGINNGDLVLIRQQQIAQNGDRVVALIDDEATIKEFQRNGNMIVLKPKSKDKKHQPIVLTQDFKIQGVVETVIPI